MVLEDIGWRIEGDNAPAKLAIVIPALGEGEQLWATLRSISRNPAQLLQHSVVVVVINSRADSEAALVEQNRCDLERLRQCCSDDHRFGALRLAWVDATSPPLQLPAKKGGVGLARKIGCDLVLQQLEQHGVLVQLDADTLVDRNYLFALDSAFAIEGCDAAVIPYRHQNGADTNQQRAIDLYELYLRYHVLGLRYARSPYAYHSLGSAIACRKSSYIKAGGMNCRRAGEDFYFLQQLAKTCSGIATVKGTLVRPAARISQRTPFGTGQVVRALSSGSGSDRQQFYAPSCYVVLRDWLQLINNNIERSAQQILALARDTDKYLAQFIEQENFTTVWQRLCRTHKNQRRRLNAFHEWFDALKTMRCIHHLSAHAYPMAEAQEHVPTLLRMVQLECGDNTEQWLQALLDNEGW